MATSQNGYPVLEPGSSKLHTWTIPARTGTVRITLRNGSAGFIIAHFLLWLAEVIEPLKGKVLDDWGHAVRPIRGQTTELSNHASGTAADFNATRHPLGVRGTLRYHPFVVLGVAGRRVGRKLLARRTHTAEWYMRQRAKAYDHTLRLGLDYRNRPDEMHVEIDRDLATCEVVARRLMRTPRGRRLLKANPGQRAVILS